LNTLILKEISLKPQKNNLEHKVRHQDEPILEQNC
jgi:hypothetical protein